MLWLVWIFFPVLPWQQTIYRFQNGPQRTRCNPAQLAALPYVLLEYHSCLLVFLWYELLSTLIHIQNILNAIQFENETIYIGLWDI